MTSLIKSHSVVVIGAGIAGLTTTYRLHQNGIDVQLYEARNRVGGRIFTVNIDGHVAELGAHNIKDGGEAENLLRIIQELDLELVESQVDLNHFYFNGEELISVQDLLKAKKFHPEILRNQIKRLASQSHNMREVLNGIFHQEDPLYKIIAVRMAAYEGAPVEKLSSLYTETLFHMLTGGISAAHQVQETNKNYVKFLSIKGGNSLLPEKIANILGDHLHLNQPLRQVSKNTDDSFLLTFKDGHQIKADRIVLTIPCSTYDQIIFEKNVMPLEKLEGIKSVQYGTNAKILIPCSKLPEKAIGILNDRLVSFFDFNCRTLTLYYVDKAGLFSKETIVDTYLQDRAMIEKGLKDFCPPFALPVFAADQAFGSYKGAVGYSWPRDPYTRGSYSYITSGQEKLLTSIKEECGEKVKTLFAPINRRLFFAGEHTSILMDVPGTMEAACESGERAARLILNDH